jgi:hypothetical protein
MSRLLLPIFIALLLAVPATAQAPSFSLSFSPAKAGKAATGTLVARDLPPEPQGTPPVDVLVLAMQPGFVADPRGVPARCKEGEAYAVKCPPNTQLGKGTAVLEAALVGGSAQQYTATLGVFLTEQKPDGALAGLQLEIREPETGTVAAVPGRVLKTGRDGGLEVRFEGMSKAVPTPPPGFTVQLKSFEMTVGRKRTVTRRVRTKSGKRRRVKRTYTVLRTPKACGGTWSGTLVIGRSDGSETLQALNAPCTP